MIQEISDICMFLNSVKEIGEAKDAAKVYEVKVKASAANQENMIVTEYANQLKSLWIE